MGADNLFHKNRAKKIEQLARQKDKRQPYARVLIVCGGETERNYFQKLKKHLGLGPSVVIESRGVDPLSLVRYAIEKYEHSESLGDTFDKVFCVFDQDDFGNNYKEACQKITSKKYKGVFSSIASVPCFEYWVLLHFDGSTAPFFPKGKKSVADTVKEKLKLKRNMPNYNKTDISLFDQLLSRLSTAKKNAANALKEAGKNKTDNPSTHVHELVEYLENLKAR